MGWMWNEEVKQQKKMKTVGPEAVPDFEWKKRGGEKGIIPYECLISILFLVYKCGQTLFWGR